ncbi:MAG: hypothetical protein JWQ40_3850 [Segetibacter sp.]|nr:hypothetical protein [Segetibacter sp.]
MKIFSTSVRRNKWLINNKSRPPKTDFSRPAFYHFATCKNKGLNLRFNALKPFIFRSFAHLLQFY